MKKLISKPLVCALFVLGLVAAVAPPANAHVFGIHEDAVNWGSCQADHWTAYGVGNSNTESFTYQSNCWSTYSRVWFTSTTWAEASGSPVDSFASWPGHQLGGTHIVCYGLFNCASNHVGWTV